MIMLDPYPIGIRLERANHTFGCNGCDGCETSSVTDVAVRVATVRHLLGSFYTEDERMKGSYIEQVGERNKEVWVVLQAFGGEGHWSRPPTAMELRVEAYLSLIHGIEGIMLWLREANIEKGLIKVTSELSSVNRRLIKLLQRHVNTYLYFLRNLKFFLPGSHHMPD